MGEKQRVYFAVAFIAVACVMYRVGYEYGDSWATIPVVPPCVDAHGRTGGIGAAVGARSVSLCSDADGSVVEHRFADDHHRLTRPRVEVGPLIRFPHSLGISEGKCIVRYSVARQGENWVQVAETVEYPLSIDRPGLAVCYSDQAPSRVAMPAFVVR